MLERWEKGLTKDKDKRGYGALKGKMGGSGRGRDGEGVLREKGVRLMEGLIIGWEERGWWEENMEEKGGEEGEMVEVSLKEGMWLDRASLKARRGGSS
ncbi:hypothetical protein Ancab_006316 [Ancistrocladus abbreviatus]